MRQSLLNFHKHRDANFRPKRGYKDVVEEVLLKYFNCLIDLGIKSPVNEPPDAYSLEYAMWHVTNARIFIDEIPEGELSRRLGLIQGLLAARRLIVLKEDLKENAMLFRNVEGKHGYL